MLAMHLSTSITVGTPAVETNRSGPQYPSQLVLNGSLLSRRMTGPSLLTLHGLRTDIMSIQRDTYTASVILTTPGCGGTRCARLAMERYVGHAASM